MGGGCSWSVCEWVRSGRHGQEPVVILDPSPIPRQTGQPQAVQNSTAVRGGGRSEQPHWA